MTREARRWYLADKSAEISLHMEWLVRSRADEFARAASAAPRFTYSMDNVLIRGYRGPVTFNHWIYDTMWTWARFHMAQHTELRAADHTTYNTEKWPHAYEEDQTTFMVQGAFVLIAGAASTTGSLILATQRKRIIEL